VLLLGVRLFAFLQEWGLAENATAVAIARTRNDFFMVSSRELDS
jgi:hypothetical protein